ncbi:prospero homeobox protein 1-like [Hypomesus transpacificus]|uniref:prospero homeobox protein 1-like n=1 Tax=Hypomesus transpacificus TaxID=137520 RepID=UPI001F07B59D|nr:prospero homeobox protein 1-like [Hypomesus transpacificus]
MLTGNSGAQDLPLGDCHQAKRARVENIIRGMAGSPEGHFADEKETGHLEELETIQENKTNVFPNQDEIHSGGSSSIEGQTLKKQLHTMQQLLGQLHEKCIQVYMRNECNEKVSDEASSTGMSEDNTTWNTASPETITSEVLTDPYHEIEMSSDITYPGWKNIKLLEYIRSKPEKEKKILADTLKDELSRAVNTTVDSIFKNIANTVPMSPPLQEKDSETHNKSEYHNACKPPSSIENCLKRFQACSASAMGVQLPNIQTEALSLVVEKASMTSQVRVNMKGNSQDHLHSSPVYSHQTFLQGNQLLENLKHNSQGTFEGLQCKHPTMGQSTIGLVDLPWEPVKVKSKVTSRPVRSHQAQPLAMDRVVLDRFCVPNVKMECGTLQSMLKNHSYVVNEGLTTSHLKKAKLMFFYTRYPSSTVLKTFFPDVQFTRCITSQLIKWFSNFREFYYIQVEKFARHALMEGVTNVRELTVGRDSELFRGLNMHYNKGNDFQVPDRFLEVAGITLQEFYIALSLAKDSDPSWKKAIYKVICKLDSDVPNEFKAPLTT